MAIDTKPNFNSKKFEQCTNDIMNLSGCTQIYGYLDIESGATLSICGGAGAGKVLTSDAIGVATWQEPDISTSGDAIKKEISQSSHGFSVQDVVGFSGGTYNKPIADGTYDGEILGIVSAVPNINTFELTQAGYVTGLTGLVQSTTYFLSDSTAGLLTSIQPTGDTYISKAVLLADSTTNGWVLPYPAYAITTGDTGGGVWGTITGTLSDQTDLYNQLTGITAETATKLSTAVFNTYTGDTNTRISTIETNYITGATNIGTGINIYGDVISDRELEFRTILGSGDTTISTSGNTIIVYSETGGGTITGATNIGAGTGTIYKQVSGNNIELRTISASGDTLISTVGDIVNVYSKCFRTTDLITTYTCGNIGLGDCLYSVNTTGNNNVAIGNCALSGNTTGNHNIAIGEGAVCIKAGQNDNIGIGRCTLRNTTIGGQIAIGAQALLSNTTGCLNYAIGFNSQTCNTTGTANISYGASSLACNSTGGGNIAIGYQASLCTTATNNIAIGCNALQCQNTGSFNIGIGAGSLCATTGTGNIGVGVFTLQSTNAGNNNVGIGRETMTLRVTGSDNIGIGCRAMYNGCGGNCNIAIGINAICAVTTGSDNIAIGGNVLCATNTGCSNIGIGILALRNNTTGANNIAIGTRSLNANVSGGGNVAMGHFVLCRLVSGTGNIAIGGVMTNSTGASTNVVIGSSSSTNNNGIDNVVIGNQTMMSNTIGCRNVVLGAFGGYVGNITGSSNVFIGYCAGSDETGSNRLYIDNTSTATPLIYGEFDTDILKLNSCLYIRDVGDGTCNDSVLTWDASTCAVRKVPYVSGSTGGGLEWTGSTANGIGSYSSSGTICSNPNLTFDGNSLGVTANILFSTGANRSICYNAATTSGSASILSIIGNQLNCSIGVGGNINIIGGCKTGGGLSCGGYVNVCAGSAVNPGGGGAACGGNVLIWGGFGCSAGNASCGGCAILAGGGACGGSSNVQGCAILAHGSNDLVYVEKLRTLSNGVCVTGCGFATDWIASSDCRLKTDIQPISNALSLITQLCGVCYKMCDDECGENRIGLIAQEVLPIIPEIISYSMPDEKDIESGITDEKLGLKYDKLTAVLIEAIKEQQIQINDLIKEVNILKNR